MDNAESYWTEGGKHLWMATFCIRVTISFSPSLIPQSSQSTYSTSMEPGKGHPRCCIRHAECGLGSKTRTIATPKKEDQPQNQSTDTSSPESPTVVESVRIPAPSTDLKDSQVNSERTRKQRHCVTKSAQGNRPQSPTTLSGLADVEPSDDETKMYPAKTAVTKAFRDPGEGNKIWFSLGTHP